MDSTNIIAILLFIIPGIIAQKVSNRMDMPSDKHRSEFGELVNGILLSVPIVVVVGIIISLFYKITTITDFASSFNNLGFIMVFLGLTIIFALILGVMAGLQKDKIIDIVNCIRTKHKRMNIDDKSCWRKLFLDNAPSKYVSIKINGETYSGFTKHYSLTGDEKEIVIYMPEECDPYPEIKNKFTKIRNTYVNIEKNVVILDYDMKEYNDYLEKLKSKTDN